MVSSTINSALAFDVVQRQHSRSGDQVFVSHTMFSETAQVIGYAMGCLSALFYLLGRVMQLNDNIKQKSTQGVSIVTFWLIIVANATYGISVCLGGSGVDYYVLHLPWLVGSFGCIFMDAVVMFQYYFVYSTRFSSKVQPRSDGTSCCKNAF
ncbi:unnamed protein product [Soboliphyme baturini]|uniref:DNA damage-regulated autophagy modulator protein 2 n=1 Tax=Soboliphyme baturini TaxID=241478 RepID=A0A183IIB2_9BILA|nr:unnamed protein product [Soboliphyme baturini]